MSVEKLQAEVQALDPQKIDPAKILQILQVLIQILGGLFPPKPQP